MRYLNLAIFVFLSLIYLSFSSQIKFSTNFIEIFFSQKSLKLFDISKQFGLSNEIYISKKGFTKSSFEDLKKISSELKQIPEISHVKIDTKISKKIKNHLVENYYLLSDFNTTKKINIESNLQNIHDKIYNSVVYEPINQYDPLDFFTSKIANQEKYFKLKDYGYMIKAQTSVNTSDAASSRVVYEKINKLLENYEDTLVYAPFFFLVENSAYIRGDAQKIMMMATFLLLILYFFILKNYKLFFNTVIAIGSSILLAILLTDLIFKSVSILAIVFGVSITTISIDYMFHYYFHKKFAFSKKVFFGFLTTFGVFVIFSFIKIELFSQLALFSLISLSMAYMIFTFIFSHLNINFEKIKISYTKNSSFKPLTIVFISLLLFGYSYENLKFDNDLKNLDYNNEKLLKISKQFDESLQNSKYRAVIIKANSKELLLQKYENISYKYPTLLGIGNFILSDKKCYKKLKELEEFGFINLKKEIEIEAKKIGFKEGTFQKAYVGMENLKCDMKLVEGTKFKIVEDKSSYYTMALINKKELKEDSLFEIIDLVKTLSNDTNEMKNRLVNFMLISILFIIAILFLVAGKKMLYPLMYLLFPISVTLFSISLFGSINIMHIFAIVILLAISIDYGIYMFNNNTLSETKMAIKFALLSTFFGFGVLFFSQTEAMSSIGFVITVEFVRYFFFFMVKCQSLNKIR